MGKLSAGHEPMVRLLDLIPAYRIVERVREVREEVEVVPESVSGDLGQRTTGPVLPIRRRAVPVRVPAVRGIDRSKPAQGA